MTSSAAISAQNNFQGLIFWGYIYRYTPSLWPWLWGDSRISENKDISVRNVIGRSVPSFLLVVHLVRPSQVDNTERSPSFATRRQRHGASLVIRPLEAKIKTLTRRCTGQDQKFSFQYLHEE